MKETSSVPELTELLKNCEIYKKSHCLSSVRRNWHMNKKLSSLKIVFGLKPFISPYKWEFAGAVLMVIISVVTMVSAPSVGGYDYHTAGKRFVACRKHWKAAGEFR